MSDHQRPHERAGQQVSLRLAGPDPSGVLYTGLLVKVLDWQDRATGMVWGKWREGPRGLQRHYFLRARDCLVTSDPDVVAVEAVEGGPMFLVHDLELGRRVDG